MLRDTRTALRHLSRRATIVLQWIPSHCDIAGNEKADALSKVASKIEQISPPVTYEEAKAIVHNKFQSEWKRRLGLEGGDDPIHQLKRHQQTTLFRLRTGHCRLLSHLNKLKISHTEECPCGTRQQTPEHILQQCPTFDALAVKPGQLLWTSRKNFGVTVPN